LGVVPPETAIRATPRAFTAAAAADANSSAAPAASSAGVGQILYVTETGRGIRSAFASCLFDCHSRRESAFALAIASLSSKRICFRLCYSLSTNH
jgi:hypothetical protein